MSNKSVLAILPCLLATLWFAACGGSSNGSGGGGAGLNISPKQAAVVVTSQTQQFTATVTGSNTAVTWTVDGTAGGSATVGTISATGLYTPPATAGTHTIVATSSADTSKSASATIAVTDLPGVITHHNDVARDGANIQELALTPATVTSTTFGKRFSCAVDGAAYTQPLWVPALNVNGALHNVIFVATQHDSVYAFDADASPCVQLWQAQLLAPSRKGTSGETPVPTADVGNGFQDIQPEIGVTGTPVIDPATSTLYVVSKSENLTGTFFQRLHALDLASGNEKFNGPVDITATFPGTGDSSSGGIISFNPQTEHQRSALALSNGIVYIAWASHEDKNPYHGWILGYNAATLAQGKVLNLSPDGARAGIWMAGGAPAFDSAGNLYVTTGNGTFDANQSLPPKSDYGDSILRISTSAALAVTDWFTPFNQAFLDTQDLDLGSSGVVLLPDQSSAPTHLLVASGKQGQLYLLNRDAMGAYCNGCASDSNVLQSFPAFQNLGSFWGAPAFWQNKLYLGGTQEPPGAGDKIKVFDFNPSTHSFATTPSSQSSAVYGYPGSTPSISSQGASAGIVWSADVSAYGVPAPTQGPAILHAYDATNLGTELWNSSQAAANRDQAGDAVKFSVPTVANGKVYLGTRTELEVYGLLP
jgi:hypothetical protein